MTIQTAHRQIRQGLRNRDRATTHRAYVVAVVKVVEALIFLAHLERLQERRDRAKRAARRRA